MALNCERSKRGDPADDGEPCGECATCKRIWVGATSLDVVEIDAASNRGVDDARDLRERAMYAPSSDSRYKVYIIDEAHMLTREAWNALLKILEEPPPRVVFVFATTEPQKIAQAAMPVLSRLQRFDLKRISAPEIRARLGEVLALEKVTASPDAIALIARAADGSMRDALSLSDQVLAHSEGSLTVELVRDSLGLVAEEEFLDMLDLVLRRDAAAVFPAVARLADEGIDFTLFLGGFADVLRGLLATSLGSPPADASESMRQALSQRVVHTSSADLLRMLNITSELEPRFRRSTQQQLILETLLVRFALLDKTVELETLLEDLGGGGGRGGVDSGKNAPAQAAPSLQKKREPASPVVEESRPLARPVIRADSAARQPPESAAERAEKRGPATTATQPLDINRLSERWDDIVDTLRESGRSLLAGHLAAALPSAVSARGVVTLQLDDDSESAHELVLEALTGAESDLLAAIARHLDGARKVTLAPSRGSGRDAATAQKRVTEVSVKTERLASLRRKDPLLDAAVRELDLELLD
jgi:DNA polymerase-3 subunit gamma/tau